MRERSEAVGVRNGEPERLCRREDEGIGVRVRVGGAWGFAGVRGSDRAAGEEALRRALTIARAQPLTPARPLAPEPPARGGYASPCEENPFAVALEDKLDLLVRADDAMRAQPGVSVARGELLATETEKEFTSTEGARCQQRLVECGGGVTAVASGEKGSQVRSWPASHGGDVAQAGFEHVRRLDLVGGAPIAAEQCVELLSAPPCPSERTTLILAGEQLGLQLHESVGHALELDRVLGLEASYAGTSFVSVEGIGSLRYGSALMNVTADAARPGGLGSYRWDDEGVEASALPLVRGGVLCGFLSSRESAREIGLTRSGGCMRADGFARQPIVRMTNVNLDPGQAGSLEDLIAATDRGILIETNRSWSIDSRRLQFRFGGEAAWEIRDGSRGRLLRDPSYAGVTPQFWAGLDAVCSQAAWGLNSLLHCGKGEPGQVVRVSHGSAPARFRDVDVGVA